MHRINARTSGSLSVTFRDKAGVPTAPQSVSYRIDCTTTRRNIRPPTNVSSPAAQMELPITSDDTAIVNRQNKEERRVVTIVATYTGPEDQATSEAEFTVVNLPNL